MASPLDSFMAELRRELQVDETERIFDIVSDNAKIPLEISAASRHRSRSISLSSLPDLSESGFDSDSSLSLEEAAVSKTLSRWDSCCKTGSSMKPPANSRTLRRQSSFEFEEDGANALAKEQGSDSTITTDSSSSISSASSLSANPVSLVDVISSPEAIQAKSQRGCKPPRSQRTPPPQSRRLAATLNEAIEDCTALTTADADYDPTDTDDR